MSEPGAFLDLDAGPDRGHLFPARLKDAPKNSAPAPTSAGIFHRPVLWAAAVFCLSLIAYFPSLRSPLLWNDSDYVTRPDLRSAGGLRRIWLEVGATQQYYPVLHSAFWLEHRLWGDATAGYHLTNALLHALSACLFALVLRQLCRRADPGGVPSRIGWEWLAALIFVLHPICVESVAWISEQKNTLSTVFYLSAALAYFRFHEKWRGGVRQSPGDAGKSASAYLLATGLFVLAILSKSVTATLPAALLVALWWRQGSLGLRREIAPLIPWFGLGAATGLFTAWVERRYIGAEGAAFTLSFAQRFLVAGRAIWFYLSKLVWPADLIFIYPRWEVDAGSWRQWLFPLAAAAALAALWRFRRRCRGPLAALLFFIGSLFPVLGFLNVYAFVFSFVADHFQYLACLGPIALAAAGFGKWCQFTADGGAPGDGLPWRPIAIAGAILCGLGVLTWRQCGNYRDLETFYRRILERNPASWMAEDNLGHELDAAGRGSEAIGHFEAALRLWPGNPNAHNNLGVDLKERGRRSEAIEQFETALRLRPRYVEARINLANAKREAGQISEAIGLCEAALRLRPNYPEARQGLGLALAAAGRLPEAIAQYQKALEVRPDLAEIHNNLGVALMGSGRRGDAIAEFEETLRLDPGLAQAHLNLGVALAAAGSFGPALSSYQEALRIKPGYAQAHNNLGLLWAQNGQMEKAVEEFRAAIRFDPGYADARRNLGIALQALGSGGEGAGGLEKAKSSH